MSFRKILVVVIAASLVATAVTFVVTSLIPSPENAANHICKMNTDRENRALLRRSEGSTTRMVEPGPSVGVICRELTTVRELRLNKSIQRDPTLRSDAEATILRAARLVITADSLKGIRALRGAENQLDYREARLSQ